jgi:hypothetical protein
MRLRTVLHRDYGKTVSSRQPSYERLRWGRAAIISLLKPGVAQAPGLLDWSLNAPSAWAWSWS